MATLGRRPLTIGPRSQKAQFGNSLQVSTSAPQKATHLARSSGPLPITLAMRKSARSWTSFGAKVAGKQGWTDVAQFTDGCHKAQWCWHGERRLWRSHGIQTAQKATQDGSGAGILGQVEITLTNGTIAT